MFYVGFNSFTLEILVSHVGFNSFAPEILVFLVGSNVFLGVQSFRESCFMWVLVALMKNPCDSCGFKRFGVSRASESRVSCGF